MNIKDCWLTIPWLCSLATSHQEQRHTYTNMRTLMGFFFLQLNALLTAVFRIFIRKIYINILVTLNSRLHPWCKKLDWSTATLHIEVTLKMFFFSFCFAWYFYSYLLFLCEITNKGRGKNILFWSVQILRNTVGISQRLWCQPQNFQACILIPFWLPLEEFRYSPLLGPHSFSCQLPFILCFFSL